MAIEIGMEAVHPGGFIKRSVLPDGLTVTAAAAIAGEADLIVSGDKKHMLALGTAEGIPIVTARDALHRLHGA